MAQVRRLLGDDAGAESLLRRCLLKLRGTSDRCRRSPHAEGPRLRADEAGAPAPCPQRVPGRATTGRSDGRATRRHHEQIRPRLARSRMGRQRSACRHLQVAREIADTHGVHCSKSGFGDLVLDAAPERAIVELKELRAQAEPLGIPLETASIDVDLALRLRDMGEAEHALEAVCRSIDAPIVYAENSFGTWTERPSTLSGGIVISSACSWRHGLVTAIARRESLTRHGVKACRRRSSPGPWTSAPARRVPRRRAGCNRSGRGT